MIPPKRVQGNTCEAPGAELGATSVCWSGSACPARSKLFAP